MGSTLGFGAVTGNARGSVGFKEDTRRSFRGFPGCHSTVSAIFVWSEASMTSVRSPVRVDEGDEIGGTGAGTKSWSCKGKGDVGIVPTGEIGMAVSAGERLIPAEGTLMGGGLAV